MTAPTFRPEMQVKQYVAVVRGQHGTFMVFQTGDARYYLFAQLYPGTLTQTGLSWPVAKRDLRDDVRHGLTNGAGYQAAVPGLKEDPHED